MRAISWPLLISVVLIAWFVGYFTWQGVGLGGVLAGLLATLQLLVVVAAVAWWEARKARAEPKLAPRRTPPPRPQTLKGLYRDRPDLYGRRGEQSGDKPGG